MKRRLGQRVVLEPNLLTDVTAVHEVQKMVLRLHQRGPRHDHEPREIERVESAEALSEMTRRTLH